ncbi:TELO2-interacting protein 2-like [Watersipora subatra]|uniref:TELO2-interacting protein 2-like n=1 Tax=Watersipora subatra TaxID=2589382 RepID=UPI00355AF59C
MEAFTEDLFIKRKCSLPYTSDTKKDKVQLDAHLLVDRGLQHLDSNASELTEDELHHGIIFLATNLQAQPWNNSKLVKKACHIYDKLIGVDGVRHLLNSNSKICKKVNKWIIQVLKRDSWQEYASVYVLYRWYCSLLAFPQVSEHLDVLIPPSLLLVDSYDDELKVAGVDCLCHIIQESGKTELRWHGRAEVIYDALQKLTYTQHEPLISLLHPTIIKIMKVLEDESALAAERKVDSVYQRLLGDMYVEDKLVLRRTYALSAKLYIEYLKQDVIKHLSQTIKTVIYYLEDSCGPLEITRTAMLEILQLLLTFGSPRIETHYIDITKALLRLVVDTVMLPIDADTSDNLVFRVATILQLMMADGGCPYICESIRMIIANSPLMTNQKGQQVVAAMNRVIALLNT